MTVMVTVENLKLTYLHSWSHVLHLLSEEISIKSCCCHLYQIMSKKLVFLTSFQDKTLFIDFYSFLPRINIRPYKLVSVSLFNGISNFGGHLMLKPSIGYINP